jgi:acyl-[acyl-carrier-protein]-phospholipid O-acyltransferase/long-chain-fatty-acid--[acyl-carrier-protein] ligase
MIPHGRIEEVIEALPGAGRAVVTGIPDERRGERLAVLYESSGVTPGEMIAHLRQCGLPPLWIPKREDFVQVERIPLLGSGKADLRAVRTLLAEAVGQDRIEAVGV